MGEELNSNSHTYRASTLPTETVLRPLIVGIELWWVFVCGWPTFSLHSDADTFTKHYMV